jgi:hypothetical protein
MSKTPSLVTPDEEQYKLGPKQRQLMNAMKASTGLSDEALLRHAIALLSDYFTSLSGGGDSLNFSFGKVMKTMQLPPDLAHHIIGEQNLAKVNLDREKEMLEFLLLIVRKKKNGKLVLKRTQDMPGALVKPYP